MSKIEQQILGFEDIDLSGQDILNITNNTVNLYTYEEITQFQTLDDLLGAKKASVILYQTQQNFGHWVLIMEVGGSIEFFDPYGLEPDSELKLSAYNLQSHNGQAVPHLSWLIKRSMRKLNVNTTKLQEFARHVNTCGRWCAVRALMRNMTLDKFVGMFLFGTFEPDWYVSAITFLHS